LSEEIKALKPKKQALQNQVNEEQVQVNQLMNDIYANENLLKDAEIKKTTYFKEQADALNFLLGLLLEQKAKNRIYLIGYDKNMPLESIDKADVIHLITGALANSATAPTNWRKLLQDILSQTIPSFAGSLATPDYERKTYLNRKQLAISSTDLGAILSLKIAIAHGHSIQLQSNLIALALPGGLLAKIEFRSQTVGLAKFQKSETELFAKGYQGFNREYGRSGFWSTKSETLYHQSGYADSELEITVPYGYYILSNDYVIEISFEAAPMLLGADAIARFAPNIAGKAKKDKERQDQEEEEDWD
jgi:hypothetical protein